MHMRPLTGEYRTFDRIRYQYKIEKRLAHKLRCASRQEREYLYSSLYEELFARVPDHPQLISRASTTGNQESVMYSMRLLRTLFNKDITFLEVGPGDCALSFEVSNFVHTVFAIDVSNTLISMCSTPANFTLILSDSTSIPLSENSVDVVFSDQLMEHLHPDDAFQQLINIYKCLSIGGTYVCLTPNRLSGPHDISRYFDVVASGFHLKEYTFHELSILFKRVGFKTIKPVIATRRIYMNRRSLALCIESVCSLLRYIGASSIVKERLGMLMPKGIIATK